MNGFASVLTAVITTTGPTRTYVRVGRKMGSVLVFTEKDVGAKRKKRVCEFFCMFFCDHFCTPGPVFTFKLCSYRWCSVVAVVVVSKKVGMEQ